MKRNFLDRITFTDMLKAMAVILILSLVFAISKCSKEKAARKADKQLISAINDTLTKVRMKNLEEKATITTLETKDAKSFVDLKIRDSEIIILQQTVKDYAKKLKAGSSVTNTTTETTVIKTIRDTMYFAKPTDVYPTYKSTFEDKWIKYSTIANSDSTHLNLKVTNEYSVIVGKDKGKPFVDVINKNPYSTTTKLRTFQVSIPSPKKFGIGISIGAGISKDLKPAPYIGVGLNYNLIRF